MPVGFYKKGGKTRPISARKTSLRGNSTNENKARKHIVQIVYCHKNRVGHCNRHSSNDFIMFDEQGFPWRPAHFPKDRKTNLGTAYSPPRRQFYVLYPEDHSKAVKLVTRKPKRTTGYGYAEGPFKTLHDVDVRLNWRDIPASRRPV